MIAYEDLHRGEALQWKILNFPAFPFSGNCKQVYKNILPVDGMSQILIFYQELLKGATLNSK